MNIFSLGSYISCNKIIKKVYDNIGDINKEIENYNNFKEIL